MESIPALLKAWRESKGLSVRAAERAVEAATGHRLPSSTINRLETKSERISHINPAALAQLDEAYGAGHALMDMAAAVGTAALPPRPGAVPPRYIWAHNFQYLPGRKKSQSINGGPVWAWVRPGPGSRGRVKLTIHWAVFSVPIEKACGPAGLLLHCPISSAHPAAFIEWSGHPGWVDFGHGKVPDLAGGPEVVDTVKSLTIGPLAQAAQRVMQQHVRLRFGRDAVLWLKHVLPVTPEFVEKALSNRPDAPQPLSDLPAGRDPARYLTPDGYASLRNARGLSLDGAEQALNDLGVNASADTIGRFEKGERVTNTNLISALDVAYRCDGHSFCEERKVKVHDGDPTPVDFPRHWVGPVWVRAEAPESSGAEGEIVVRWGEWVKRQTTISGAAVAFRRDTPDSEALYVTVPRGWTLYAGIGYNPQAHDLNRGWDITDGPSAEKVAKQHAELLPQLWGRDEEAVVGQISGLQERWEEVKRRGGGRRKQS